MTGTIAVSSRSTLGLTLLELLITVTIVLIMVGAAGYNYTNIVEEQKVGKAHNECQEFVKALKAWENKKGRPVSEHLCTICMKTWLPRPDPPDSPELWSRCRVCGTDYRAKPDSRIRFHLSQLEVDRVMPQVPDDPWSVPYGIETTRGFVYSCGPDTLAGTGDDVKVPFRPPFELQRAFFDPGSHSVVAVFSRALDRSVLTSFSLSIHGTAKVDYSALSVDMHNPYQIKASLPATETTTRYRVDVTGRARLAPVNADILAMDGTSLDITKITSVWTGDRMAQGR